MTGPSPAPAEGPATAADVAARLGGVDVADVAGVVAAVNRMCRYRWGKSPLADGSWAGDDVEGANMLATRLFSRRNSPSGVAAFGAEGAAYVSRNDPDVAQLLQLGAYMPPRVG